MPKSALRVQLSETCQLTGAEWAVWLERGEGWQVRAAHHLEVRRRAALMFLLETSAFSDWLNGALAANRPRSRKISPQTGLTCGKLFAFPDPLTQSVLLVGAAGLTTAAQRFWRVVSLGGYVRPLLDLAPVSALGSGFYLPDALERILTGVLRMAGSPAGWIAIRSGDFLDIRACSNCAETGRLSIEAVPALRGAFQEKRACLISRDSPHWSYFPLPAERLQAQLLLLQPLLIGRRTIGVVGLYFSRLISPREQDSLKKLSSQIAPAVEGVVIFSDLSTHLRRMALLNDFFVSISAAADVENVVQRTFALLQRAFGAERVFLLILSPDQSEVQQYVLGGNAVLLRQDVPADSFLLRQVAKAGGFRGDIGTLYQPFYPDSRSALAVVLKHQRRLIGLIGLESEREGRFTLYDEHLLSVIAGYLATLLDNNRLRQEAEGRARNLELIHEVVRQTIGLTDVQQMAQIAADLIARDFDYEMAGVALVNPDGSFKLAGVGGTAADIVRKALSTQEMGIQQGIVGRVLVTGQSMLVNNVAQNPFSLYLPGWEANSEMCVALKSGDAILGAIDVESSKLNAFTQNDLLTLESLAGILGGAISAARQYQNSQATVNQLQAARQQLQERIAAQKMAESRLVQAAKLAAVGEMAAGVAHELNNPLTTVVGFTELALESIPPDRPAHEDLQLVLREAKRARDVVRRLLDFARQGESLRTRSDLNEIVADALALTNHLLRTGGVLVQTNYAADLPWVLVDRNQIKQVLLNLIHNALHAMPSGGNLYISTAGRTRNRRRWATIALRDTGVGIASEHLDRLFEPFFTTRSEEGGTGLGLSVSYGIVADHGGEIEVSSKVGEGSTFTIWLPIEAS